jgi:dihydropteroate synthase
MMRKEYVLHLPGGRRLDLGRRTAVMGILNVTPDSFSDGGLYLEPARAVERAVEMAAAGADIIDVGGESTRPGSTPVPADEEMRRVLPVIERLVDRTAALISIDTYKAETAAAAVRAGAAIINDIRGLADPRMAAAAARTGAALVVMHCPVEPAVMQSHADYSDVVAAVIAYLSGAIDRAVAAGVPRDRIVADPGIGFAKTGPQSAAVIERLAELSAALDRPVLLGPSRKSFIGRVIEGPPESRVFGTAAATAYGIARGAHIVRVHDVVEMVQVVRLCDFIADAGAN